MAFFLTNLAKADLKDIGRYTQKKWGIKQRNIYLTVLDNAFHFLAENPNKGRNCDEIRPAYKKYIVWKHIIFYRETDGVHIEIVRILHGSMDTGKQFG